MGKHRTVPIVILIVVLFVSGSHALQGDSNEAEEVTSCAHMDNKVTTKPGTGEITWEMIEQMNEERHLAGGNGSRVQRCDKANEFCYTLWFIDPQNKSRTAVLLQGCWENQSGNECPSECVTTSALTPKGIRNNTRFCCCMGNMCNVNVTDAVNLTASDILASRTTTISVSRYVDPFYRTRTIIISLASVVVVAIIVIVLFTFVRCCLQSRGDSLSGDTEASMFLVGGATGKGLSDQGAYQLDLENLKLDSLLSRGRYGEVYKAVLNDATVAVKMLCPPYRQYYYSEKEILSLPLMQHPSIVEYFGARERYSKPDGSSSWQFVIVTSYMPLGSLSGYLKNSTVDWFVLCRMAQSIVTGIAHLHTEIMDGDKVKPTIAHRDINSRNILVRDDLTCCICDFGFAMKIVSARLADATAATDDVEEHASLADVGTLRYMAPEVLEGSVNLYDCKSSLTQVDIYAFGLVLWEVGTRCHELYQGLPTPEYQLPFEQEVGLHPTFEEMQVLVSRNKARPMFPDTWKDTNQAMKTMKDTIEECWDQDAEARISAVCVEERIREMAMLWENRLKHVTPTSNIGQHLNDLESVDLESVDIVTHESAPGSSSHDSCTESDPNDSSHTSHTDNEGGSLTDENSVSTVTVETVVTPADMPNIDVIVTPRPKADCNVVYAQTVVPLRAHQGLNPTVARNTHKDSDEELAVEGNSLVGRTGVSRIPSFPLVANDSLIMDIIATGVAPDTETLLQSGILQQTPPALPPPTTQPVSRAVQRHTSNCRIPYTQNQMNSSSSGSGGLQPTVPLFVRPKKQNVPSNGGINHLVAKAPQRNPSATERSRRFTPLKALRRLAMPYLGLKGSAEGEVGTENLPNGSVPSEACLVNGMTVVRPTVLPLAGVIHQPSEAARRSVGPDNLHRNLQSVGRNMGDRSSVMGWGAVDTAVSATRKPQDSGTAVVQVSCNDNTSRTSDISTSQAGCTSAGLRDAEHPRVNYGYEASVSPQDRRGGTCVM